MRPIGYFALIVKSARVSLLSPICCPSEDFANELNGAYGSRNLLAYISLLFHIHALISPVSLSKSPMNALY